MDLLATHPVKKLKIKIDMTQEETFETQFIITVKTKRQLTDDDKTECLVNLKYRLEGYHTEVPNSLINSTMNIKYLDEDGSNKTHGGNE